MEYVEVEVLNQGSSPVLRMAGRRFPGVVIQGDTLSTFLADARQIVAELRAGNQPIDDARDLADRLGELLDHYAQTLTKEGPSIGR